jgi:ketosteroid isomerase-like protein
MAAPVAPAAAADTMSADETAMMAPVHQFVDAFNKGDQKGAAAAYAPGSVSIIDDVPPHVFAGAEALQTWFKALDAADKKAGDTDGHATVGNPTRMLNDGDTGYLVVPGSYTYKEKGATMHETSQIVISVRKVSDKWLMTGWAWAGTNPKAGPMPGM